jgi:hypothetical protein
MISVNPAAGLHAGLLTCLYELADAAIEQHVSHGAKVPGASATMHLCACHRVGADDTAFAYRDATFAQVILAAWPDPELTGGWLRSSGPMTPATCSA